MYDAAQPAQRHDVSEPVALARRLRADGAAAFVVLVDAKEPSVERGFCTQSGERVRCPRLRRLTAVPPTAPRAVRRRGRRHGRC